MSEWTAFRRPTVSTANAPDDDVSPRSALRDLTAAGVHRATLGGAVGARRLVPNGFAARPGDDARIDHERLGVRAELRESRSDVIAEAHGTGPVWVVETHT